MRCGSGNNGELTFLDVIGIVSFCVGLQNLEINITQEDMDKQTADLDARVNAQIQSALSEIHGHLQDQDNKIDELLRRVGNDNR